MSLDASPAPLDHGRRLTRLREELAKAELDGLLVGHPPNVRYLSGFTGSSGLLLARTDDHAILVTDFRYEEQATEQLPADVSLRIARDGLFAELDEVVDTDPAGARHGFEPRWLTVGSRTELDERCPAVEWVPTDRLVENLRAQKGPAEIQRIRGAVRVAEEALGRLLSTVEVGVSERELTARLEFELRTAGSHGSPFEPIVAAGPRTALPHADPTDRRLGHGDLLLIDFGATRDGYASDLTRTFVIGGPAPWHIEMHEAVRQAQEVALAAIHPGQRAAEVDRAARDRLGKLGLGERFGHSTGHGIGLEVHEGPRLSRTSTDTLQAGHVVTVEPGVYLPGRGGVRIEDDVWITEGGAERLSDLSRDLRVL